MMDVLLGAPENAAIASYAREYVVATTAYEEDRYSPGWSERATRAHLARAALWGACGYVPDSEDDDSAVVGVGEK